MGLKFEKETVEYLNIPSIPKKEWDGKSHFDKGVAIIEFFDGTEACAACRFIEEQREVQVTKVFSIERYKRIVRVLVVPNYMNTEDDVQNMDLDEESKKKAKQLLQEASEMENEGVEDKDALTMDKLPEFIFPEINNKEEAEAWLRRYNSQHHIKGKMPKNEETIKLRLFAIYSELNKQK